MKEKELLIEKYWEGATTLEEEQQLRAWYEAGELSGPIADIFAFHALERSRIYHEPVANRDDNEWAEEKAVVAKTINFTKWWMLAASFLLLVTASMWMQESTVAPEDNYAIEDPDEALKTALAAFALVNNSMNQGETAVKSSIKEFDESIFSKFN